MKEEILPNANLIVQKSFSMEKTGFPEDEQPKKMLFFSASEQPGTENDNNLGGLLPADVRDMNFASVEDTTVPVGGKNSAASQLSSLME